MSDKTDEIIETIADYVLHTKIENNVLVGGGSVFSSNKKTNKQAFTCYGFWGIQPKYSK